MKNSFDEIQKELRMIYDAKNSDYGNSFDESMRKWGLLSPIIRLSDKINRLDSLRICSGVSRVRDESRFRDESLNNYSKESFKKYVDLNRQTKNK